MLHTPTLINIVRPVLWSTSSSAFIMKAIIPKYDESLEQFQHVALLNTEN
jgi:hypothetical protein